MTPETLVGKEYVFDDHSIIKVIQVRARELDVGTTPVVTYTIQQGNSLPRKLLLPYDTFISTFGHLFEE